MATRVEEILMRVQDTLDDPGAERWSVPRLLRLIDEAQNLIVSDTGYFRGRNTVTLVAGQAEYTLPPEVYAMTRVLDAQLKKLPVISHAFADAKFRPFWETRTGALPEAIIFDKLEAGKFQVYPTPTAPLDLTIFSLKMAPAITSINSPLTLHPIYDHALKFYVTGMAFRDDKDTEHRALAQEELRYFSAGLRKIQNESARDFTRGEEQQQPAYRGAFNV